MIDRQIDWFVLREGQYEKLSPADDGIVRSTIFPGLWLDPRALLNDDCEALLDVLQRGLESPEHTAFKDQLRRAKVDPTN